MSVGSGNILTFDGTSGKVGDSGTTISDLSPVFSVTTTGTSGPATYTSNVLNIPQYSGGGGGGGGGGGVSSFTFIQSSPATNWVIVHGLNTYPSVTVIDSAGSCVIGEIDYNTLNQCTLVFSGAMSGTAVLV